MKWTIVWLIYCAITLLIGWAFGIEFKPSFGFGFTILICFLWLIPVGACKKDEENKL